MRALVIDRYDRRKKVCDALGMSFIRAKALRRIVDSPMTMRRAGRRARHRSAVHHGRGGRPGTPRAGDPGPSGPVTAGQDRRDHPDGAEQADLAERILNDAPRPVRELPAADLEALDRILTSLLAPRKCDNLARPLPARGGDLPQRGQLGDRDEVLAGLHHAPPPPVTEGAGHRGARGRDEAREFFLDSGSAMITCSPSPRP